MKARTMDRGKHCWSQESILMAMSNNFKNQFAYFADKVPLLQSANQPDITVIQSKIPDDTLNCVISARFSPVNFFSRVNDVINLFENPKRPFTWWVGPLDTPKNLQEALISQGMVLQEVNEGMYLEIEEFIPSYNPRNLSFQRILNPFHLKDFYEIILNFDVNSKAFKELYSQIPPYLYSKDSNFGFYVGFFENKPVVSGILFVNEGVAGIYYILTSPEYRKRGFATLMMEYLLQQVKEKGISLAILLASKEGKQLYNKMGFRACGYFFEYTH